MRLFRYLRIASFVFSIVVFSTHAANSVDQTEEGFFLKRMEEAYSKSDYNLFLSHLAKYVEMYPNSEHIDSSLARIGNLLYENKLYSRAIKAYEMIVDMDIWGSVQLNYLKAQFELKNHETVINYLSDHLSMLTSDEKTLLLKSLESVATDQKKEKKLRLQYINQTIFIYESFDEIDQTPSVLKTLAKLYFLTRKYEKTVDVLKKLCLLEVENKEKILLQIFNVQKHFDQEQAMKTLDEICLLKGDLTPYAVYNKLILYFEQNNFEQIILLKDEFRQHLNSDQLPYLHYVLGKSYLTRGEITQADIELDSFLANKGRYESLEEDALVSLVDIAQKKKSLEKEQEIAERLDVVRKLKFVSLSEKKGLELLAIAEIYKERKNYKLAESNLKKLLVAAKNLNEKILAHFALSLLYFDIENWEGAREYFHEFIEKYPNSTLIQLAWDYFIQSSIHLSVGDHYQFTKAQLIYDLENLLMTDQYQINKYDTQKYMLLLAKIKYQVLDYEGAVETLERLLDQNPSNKILSESLLLLAHSYLYGFDDWQKYSTLIEKVMEIEPNLNLNEYNPYKLSELEFLQGVFDSRKHIILN